MSRAKPTWATDSLVSLPETMAEPDALKVDMEGFCFTFGGIRVNFSEADRDDLIASAFRPQEGVDG